MNSDAKYVMPIINYKVYDGDTVKALVALPFYFRWQGSIRITAVDTPEIRHRDSWVKAAGQEVTKVVMKWMDEQSSKFDLIFNSTEKPKFSGRAIGDIFCHGTGLSLSQYLLQYSVEAMGSGGICKLYNGGKRQLWTYGECRDCIITCQKLLSK